MNGMSNGSFGEKTESSMQERIETGRREAKETLETVRLKGSEIVKRVKTQIRERPAIGMAACAGAGFALGAMFGSRALRLLIIGGVGFLVSQLPFDRIGAVVRGELDELGDEHSKRRRSRSK